MPKILIHLYLLFILFLGSLGCSSNPESLEEEQVIEQMYANADTEILDQNSKANTRKKKKASRVRKSSIKKCEAILNALRKNITNIEETTTLSKKITKTKLYKYIHLNNKYCSKKKSQKSLLGYLKKEMNQHSNRIGIILPLSGPNGELGKKILEGIKKSTLDGELKFEDRFVVEDSLGTAAGAGRALFKMFFIHKTSFNIGGVIKSELFELVKISRNLLTPLITLNGDQHQITKSKYLFQIFPNEVQMAHKIAATIKKRGYKKIAVLDPEGGKSNVLINALEKKLAASGILIQQKIRYISGNFPSMNEAIIKFSGLGYSKRAEEYQNRTRELIRQSKVAGTKFRPESVILHPRLESEALFIPDNFRIVRHFIKLLKFHGVKKFPLIGSHEWRSKSLIEPWDNFLDGAIFADFVGSYRKLPDSIRPPQINGEYFINATNAMNLDLEMIGYYSGSFAVDAIIQKTAKRRDYAKVLKNLYSKGGFFKRRSIFSPNGTSKWPIFLFSIHSSGISQL